MTENPPPLCDLKVLDLSRLAPGPFATMILGDLGADVISIEPPQQQRMTQSLEHLEGHGDTAARAAGEAPMFRSRRSIVVDLKSPDGVKIVEKLGGVVDIFLEGFRPGVCDRLGVGYHTISRVNPSIIYCSISGFGQTGTNAQRPGHDLTYLAESGILSASTRPGQRPGIPLNIVADLAAGGLMTALAVMVALHRRALSGQGSYLDVSMLRGLLLMASPARSWLLSGEDSSWGGGLLSGAAPFYDCYPTADGQWFAVAALEEKFFRRVCEALDLGGLKDALNDRRRWPEIRQRFSAAFLRRSARDWEAHFEHLDAPVARVRSLGEAFDHARGIGLLTDVGEVDVSDMFPVTGPLRPAPRPSAPPGSDSRSVLLEHGWSEHEIDRLIDDGVIEQAPPR